MIEVLTLVAKFNQCIDFQTLITLFDQVVCTLHQNPIPHGFKEKLFERKIVNIFLSISFNLCFGCSKETALLSTHNIMFWMRNKKTIFSLRTLN